MSTESAASAFAASRTKLVPVEAIERELSGLWQPEEGEPDAEAPLTRACMSNLAIFCATRDEADAIRHQLGEIVQSHPSRVLLLVGGGAESGSDLEAHVSVLCYLAGEGRQVCSEHVTVNASEASVRKLPSAARALLIGDLPTTLWWAVAEAPPLYGEIFRELAQLADQVVYDSRGWPDPVRGVIEIAKWAGGEQASDRIADLAWRQLKPWRRLISQSLDPCVAPGALESITDVVVEHGPHALSQSWFLIGWLASHLGWRPTGGKVEPGVEVTWGFTSTRAPLRVTVRRRSEGPPEVRSISMTWKADAGSSTRTFAALDEGRIGVTTGEGDAPLGVIAAPAVDVGTLIARQLANRTRDTLFRSTLQLSRAMAEALIQR